MKEIYFQLKRDRTERERERERDAYVRTRQPFWYTRTVYTYT